MHKTRNLWLHRVIIILCAVCWAYAYTTRLSGFMGASRAEKLQLLVAAFIFLSVIPLFLIGQPIIRLSRRILAISLIRLAATGMLLSSGVLGLAAELPPFPQLHILKIRTIESPLAGPQDASVRVLSIHRVYQPGGQRVQVDPGELALDGNWQVLEDSSMLLPGDQPGSLRFEAFMQAGLKVILQAGPGQRDVEMVWDGESETLNLEALQEDSVTRQLQPTREFGRADAPRKLLLISAIFAEFTTLGSVFTLIFMVVFALQKRLIRIRKSSAIVITTPLLLILFAASIRIQHTVQFEDPGLEFVIRLALHKQAGNITARQLQTIAVLDASNQNISSLAGIQQLHNLVDLNLMGNQISDISPLRDLKKIRRLNLRQNRITNLEALSHLPNLEYLNLHSNTGIASIAPLARLVNLQTLILRNVPVSKDVSHLRLLTNLQRLNLRNTGITHTDILAELMKAGALQDDPLIGVKAELDLRDNPIDHDRSDGYAPLRTHWENISIRIPFVLPVYASLEPPVFSHPAGFYGNSFLLELTSGVPGAGIHYTLDGSEPTVESPRFTNPIIIQSLKGRPANYATRYNQLTAPYQITESQLNPAWDGPAGDVLLATVVRARVIKENTDEQSDVVTHTYLIDEEIHERHSLPVVALSTDPEYLFDYETGIYVRGNIYDRFYPQPADKPWFTPANYYQRGALWERPVHIEFLEKGYGGIFAQEGAMRIHGGAPRRFPEKSLRIYARSDYGSADVFKFQLFPGLFTHLKDKPLIHFNNFVLHNSGNDWFGTLFRDPLMQSLVEDTSLDTMAYRPVILFLNGEYWGIHALRQRMDEYYLASMYNLNPDDVAIMENNQELFRGEPGVVKHFNSVLNYAGEFKLDDPQKFHYIQTQMDLDNFIEYQVSEIYFAN